MDRLHGCPVSRLEGARFGRVIEVADSRAFTDAVESQPEVLPKLLHDADGLLLLTGMATISDDPELLIRLSRPFGTEVEDYARTTNRLNMLHPASSQIIRITNLPPVKFPPPDRPDPPTLPDGSLPVQFPQRRGWHTDQSFRRPPPHQPAQFALHAIRAGRFSPQPEGPRRARRVARVMQTPHRRSAEVAKADVERQAHHGRMLRGRGDRARGAHARNEPGQIAV